MKDGTYSRPVKELGSQTRAGMKTSGKQNAKRNGNVFTMAAGICKH
jgi:hypothetical protein